jgi:hypothetical protein
MGTRMTRIWWITMEIFLFQTITQEPGDLSKMLCLRYAAPAALIAIICFPKLSGAGYRHLPTGTRVPVSISL